MQNTEQGLTLCEICNIFLKKWWLILFSVLICTSISAIYCFNFIEDYYVAESSMIVQVSNTYDSDYNNLLTGQRLVRTYSEIASSRIVIEKLIDNLNLSLGYDKIKSMVSVTGISDTLIIKLTVKTHHQELCAEIANEIVSIVKELSVKFDGLETIDLLDPAIEPTAPSGPNRISNLLIGVFIGGVIGSTIVIVYEIFDNKFKKPRDIEYHLSLKVLGIIPDYITDEGELR